MKYAQVCCTCGIKIQYLGITFDLLLSVKPCPQLFPFSLTWTFTFLQCRQYIIHQWELKQTTNTCHLSRHKEILWKMGTFAYNDFLQYSQIHMCDCVIDFVDILGILMAPKLLVYGVNSNGTLCHSGSQMVGQGPKGFS